MSKRYNKKIISDIISNSSINSPSVLDLGIGRGDFGKLIKKLDKKSNITGVEVWEKYKNHKWNYYDSIFIEDIRDFVKIDNNYDIVLLIDVLEHFDKQDGEKVLDNIASLSDDLTIIATPNTSYPQGPFLGNPYESHKYFWNHNSLVSKGFERVAHKEVFTFSISPIFSDYGIYCSRK